MSAVVVAALAVTVAFSCASPAGTVRATGKPPDFPFPDLLSSGASPKKPSEIGLSGSGSTKVRVSPVERPLIVPPSLDYSVPLFLAVLPPGLPVPRIPPDNLFSRDKAELGRKLFFDPRLSSSGHFACASCHQPEHAFSDGRDRPSGETGEQHPRNTLALTNVAYNATYTWSDPGLTELEQQVLIPLLSEHPIEMGLLGHEEEVLADLGADESYRAAFDQVFAAVGQVHESEEPTITLVNVVRAIATFERTLLSANSAFDRALARGSFDELGAIARHGMELFFSEELSCARCHAGFNFSGPTVWHESRQISDPLFHNTGLYNLVGGAYPVASPGLVEHSGAAGDRGKFRAPSLRNVALTAPYMHDGSIATLREVVDHYAEGGRTIIEGPIAGIGRENPYKSALVRPHDLSEDDRDALVAFLLTLTDWSFVCDSAFADPWGRFPRHPACG